MSFFEENYRALNDAQRQAVDLIEGPLMVVAGPGTGKTQLLSMRVANILRQTDAAASNILCLTFTESGATAMRRRLIELMGQEAYGVAIHTFHSFGAEIINSHAEYFYHGAHFQAADELSSYEVLRELFDKLPHDNPLSSTMNGEYTYLRETQSLISDLKKSGLTSDELLKILDTNDAFVAFAEPLLQPLFADRLSKKSIAAAGHVSIELSKFQATPIGIPGFALLSDIAQSQLERAIEVANETNSTRELTTWRNSWLEKDADGQFVFKDRRKNAKLRAVATIYYEYLVAMQERAFYDFDDMILRVVHATEVFAQLRYDLQEQYQYILVDEFQDTNGAQLRLLFNLINSESNADQPNIMVVGDDDQAIYAFQGAEIGNIITFRSAYPTLQIVTLTDNYRSRAPILGAARSIITQGQNRLENTLENLNKQLKAHNSQSGPDVSVVTLPTVSHEYHWLAGHIQERIAKGIPAQEIAVIARNHRQLLAFLPYLHQSGLPVAYERRSNVLDSPPVALLELLAIVISGITDQAFEVVEAKLPELLSHPAWQIPPKELWQLSLKAHKDRQFWLEVMLSSQGKLRDIAEWLIVTAHEAQHQPLERILDTLIGSNEAQAADNEADENLDNPAADNHESYHSPLRAYFFEQSMLEKQPAQYIAYLGALTTLRRALREYIPNKELRLRDFSHFVELHRRTGISITASTTYQEAEHAVQLMTAHKSKGLEFHTVFVIDAQDNIWGTSSRARPQLIGLPHNLPLRPAGESDDERLRLLYVAMTRAKNELVISAYTLGADEKESTLAKFLQTDALPNHQIEPHISTQEAIIAAETVWHERLIDMPKGDIKKLLAPRLQHYKLSATHLNNFIDVTSGGPQTFLLQNLLRFPQSMSPHAMFGSAIHGTLQRAHGHLAATGNRRPVEDVLHDFEQLLSQCNLGKRDFEYWLQKGSDVLNIFLHQRYDSFTDEQIVEKDFAAQGVCIGEAQLSGAIDLLDIDKTTHQIIVTDYKTGKALSSWQGKTDFDKIKLHKYKQQLMLYKLLIEGSREYGKTYRVERGLLEFVEPDATGQICRLEMGFDTQELAQFSELLQAVWRHIMKLDLPDISHYPLTYKGILAFEADLLAGDI